jgi:sugar lactone lactonase YvrE
MNVEVAFEAGDILGEGPVWSVVEQALYWVDIQRPSLQRFQPEDGTHNIWPMPSQIGSYALRQAGGFVVALQSGLAFFDPETAEFTALIDPESDIPETRFNDGKCDRQGRFWAGTMGSKEERPLGSLYRLDADHSLHTVRRDVAVSNGLGWSPDNRTMYYADSPTYNIYAFDFEPETGALSNERIFAHHKKGFPDGLTVDSEGFVWSARWDGWQVIRFAPDGRIDRIIEMPVQRPTSCIFGGPELRHLYITSASTGLREDELARQPLAGHVFVVEADVTGLPEPLFAG